MTSPDRPVYLDCAATTPIDPRVRDVVLHYMDVEFGNAGSRTHIFGQEASKGVQTAREQIAAVADAHPEEVIFTSGATEANNLAILGLAEYGEKEGKRHIISTQIEHKAVLEPLQRLANRGFQIDLVAPSPDGFISAEEVQKRLRSDTLLVSVMHVNNETGVIQPINEIARLLHGRSAIFHVDAAQGFGKDLELLQNERIDLLSASAHKLYAPKGIGALIARNQNSVRRKLSPLMIGGGQERGLRPGTLPVPLITGFGRACELALSNLTEWRKIWETTFTQILQQLDRVGGKLHGHRYQRLQNIINFSIDGLDSEACLISVKDLVSVSNGSACTSEGNRPSHVITAMHPFTNEAEQAIRLSWCHLSPKPPIKEIFERIAHLR